MRPRLPRPSTGESPAHAAARSPDRPEWRELSPQTWAVGSTPHAPHPQSPSRFQILVSFRGRPDLSPLHGSPNSPLQSRLSNPCLYLLVLASPASPPRQVRAPPATHTPLPPPVSRIAQAVGWGAGEAGTSQTGRQGRWAQSVGTRPGRREGAARPRPA